MKKRCPQCDILFSGRTDKQFCSNACKNQFHNQQRKSDVGYTIDQTLHMNRTILHKLVSKEDSQAIWQRDLLARLGFNFDVFTGIQKGRDGTVAFKVYEYCWKPRKDGTIELERILEEAF